MSLLDRVSLRQGWPLCRGSTVIRRPLYCSRFVRFRGAATSSPALLGDEGSSGIAKEVMKFLVSASSTVTGKILNVTGLANCLFLEIRARTKLLVFPGMGRSLPV